MLKTIKLIHTLVWAVMAFATFYILYSGINNNFDIVLLISIILLTIETIVLLLNRWTCPFTPLARKYTESAKDNFDIYLPNWFARYNKLFFGTIFMIGMILVIANWIRK